MLINKMYRYADPISLAKILINSGQQAISQRIQRCLGMVGRFVS